ncbi:MAG: hypothetical protein U0939_27030 [Pirellulales bacterium]
MTNKQNRVVGATAGAAICSVARFVVALAFLYYVSYWGGPWWNGASDMWLAAFISALIGAPIGALAGSTCQPLLGAFVGAGLSGVSCLGLFVLPTELAIGMSHPGGFDRIETLHVLVGFMAMILAGAAAGGCGAAIGRRGGISNLGR